MSWHALDGTVEAVAARTDSAGVARARWTLGPRAGTQRLRAQVGTPHGGAAIPPVTIAATALAGPPARIVVVSGDRQRGAVAAPLRRPVVVRLLDAAGNGVADAVLVVSASAGTLIDTLARTDSSGGAAVLWTLGRSAGSQALSFHQAGLKSLDVAAWAEAGAPANLALDELRASPARAGKRTLIATATDLYGNPVSNAKLALTAKGGSVSPSRAFTDARGTVSLTWTPGGGTALTGAIAGTAVRETYALRAVPGVRKPGVRVESAEPANAKARAKAPRAARGRVRS